MLKYIYNYFQLLENRSWNTNMCQTWVCNLTLFDRMADISAMTTINQILLSGFLIFSSQASKVKTTPVAILYFVIDRGTQFFVLRYKT